MKKYLDIETINNKRYRFDLSDIQYHIEIKPYRLTIVHSDGTSIVFNMRYILTFEIVEED